MLKFLTPLLLLLLAMLNTGAQNACGTKASFTPNNDTVLYTGQAISFTNTSQNADSYEWINDVYTKTYTTDFTNFVPAVGVTQIMLVAHRNDCTDTAVTHVINNGTPPASANRTIASYGLPNTNEWASTITPAKADGYLLSGVSGVADALFATSPYFVRVSESGCILWSRMLPLNHEITVCAGIATYDSGFVIFVSNRDIRDSSFLFKFDKNGNILWSRSYLGTDGLTWAQSIREMSDHSLMVASTSFTGGAGRDFLMANLDENGSFRWLKKYYVDDYYFAALTDMVEKNGTVWACGTYWLTTGGGTSFSAYTTLFKLDLATGNLYWMKGFSSPNKIYISNSLQFFKDGLIMSGFADSLVVPYNNEWSNFETLLETDLDGNIREGKLIYNTTDLNTPAGENLIVNADNSISVFYSGSQATSLQPGYLNWSYFLRLDANKNILWQNDYSGAIAGQMLHACPAPLKGMAMIGNKMSSLSNPFYGFAENLLLLKVDSNGATEGPFCDTYETFSTIQDMDVSPWTPPGPVNTTDQGLRVLDHPLTMIKLNSEMRYICPDYVPSCAFLKLDGRNSVCNLQDTLEFIAHKDPSCVDPVKWTYDVSNIKTVYEDGGKTKLIFKTPGTYTILAEKTAACPPLSDSIIVTVAPALTNFYLGGDTTLCTGDSLVLRSAGKYSKYQWQDGSGADSFKVKTPGQFFCLVTDSCGNKKSDTISVSFRSTIPVNLGTTRFKCVGDSLTIIPPPGFRQYEWTPQYDLISSADGSVILFPAKDTIYQLTVHDNGGCTGSTSLEVRLYPSNPVSLGADTAICTGGHAIFSAGSNFNSYSWSNGFASTSIDVRVGGNYSVLATDQNNCMSSDTVVLTVYPLPALHISGGTVLCKDQDLVLDAGAGFTNYSWQDGSLSEKFIASDTGFYRVQATDLHQCTGSDSIHITQYAASPAAFLPADTTVCLYRGGNIGPAKEFEQYTWNTGETSRSILVKTAGIYTLQVVDQLGCRGADSIVVATKDCEALLVFPNAFSPNNDGLNDLFRLKYPGLVADYQLQVFNRWGQMIFSSSDPYGAWDGKFAGEPQPAGTYIWIARYTGRDGKKQVLNGSVVLIR